MYNNVHRCMDAYNIYKLYDIQIIIISALFLLFGAKILDIPLVTTDTIVLDSQWLKKHVGKYILPKRLKKLDLNI